MDLKHIKAFIAVAEEGSFTRAAVRLGIAQPPLSVKIRQLEAEVGGPLFERLAHGVEITDSGRIFLRIVRDLPSTAARGLQEARRVARGEAGVFTLGFTASSIFNDIVALTIATFRRSYPDVELRLEESNTERLLPRLRRGDLDAAFVRPTSTDGEGLAIASLPSEPLVAVLPADHAKAGGASIALADLSDEPLLLYPREIGPELFDTVIAACRNAGFTPILGQTTPQIASIVHLVAVGLGVAIVPRSMTQLVPTTVTFKEFADDGLRAPLAFAWRAMAASPAVANMAEIVRASAAIERT